MEKAHCDISECMIHINCPCIIMIMVLVLYMYIISDALNKDHNTPLHIACYKHHQGLVKYLVENAHCDNSECMIYPCACMSSVNVIMQMYGTKTTRLYFIESAVAKVSLSPSTNDYTCNVPLHACYEQ